MGGQHAYHNKIDYNNPDYGVKLASAPAHFYNATGSAAALDVSHASFFVLKRQRRAADFAKKKECF
jgi:hypothetical protein